MFISFPLIPIPSIPKISPPSQVQTGSSTSSSKVIVCVNNKCLTREQKTSSGSSFLKVTTVTYNDSTTTSVESFVSDGQASGNNIYSKIPSPIKVVIERWVEIIKIYLTKF